jgi:hypothetical protein
MPLLRPTLVLAATLPLLATAALADPDTDGDCDAGSATVAGRCSTTANSASACPGSASRAARS